MDHAHPEAIKKHIRVAILVFITLLVLTVITVAVSYVHLGHWGNIGLALFIAVVKAGLVAAYFMHLISEKRLIFLVLVFCAVFFAGMMGLILFHEADPIRM